MAKETILITGGAGFIGSSLAKRLLKMGYRIIILDDLSRSNTDSIRECYNYSPDFYFIKGSVTDFNTVDRLIQNSDIVFHLAAQVHWEESIDHPVTSFRTNTIGTLNVLESVRKNLCRKDPIKLMLYASSSEVYGTAQYVPMDEKHPFNPQSPYAAGKAAADTLCSAYHHVYKIPVIILRQFNTYGPGQRLKGFQGYSAVVPKFIYQVLNETSPTIYGSGKQSKDFHYIDDLMSAYTLILEKWKELDIFGQAINFGTGKETSINELVDVILEVVSKKTGKVLKDKLKPVHLPPRPGEVMQFVADTKFAKKKLGFEPKINLKDGISKYIDWFIENHSRTD
jgi:UDP-glucose 4-epimerase